MDLDELAVVGFTCGMMYLYLFHTEWIVGKNAAIREEWGKNLRVFSPAAKPAAKVGASVLGIIFKRLR